MIECVAPNALLVLMALSTCFGLTLALLVVRIIFTPRIKAIEDALSRGNIGL